MPQSMTGFGAAEGPVAGGRLRLEVRTVNHRHLNVQLKVPSELAELEPELRERLRAHLARGHVTVSGRWLEEPPQAAAVTVDRARAAAVVTALREAGKELGLTGDVDLSLLARLPDVLRVAHAEVTPDPGAVLDVLDRAAAACAAAREREGAALASELRARISTLGELRARIAERAPERVVAERDRLALAVQELAGSVAVDPARLAQEIAILANRLDITEELVRFGTHLEALSRLLDGGGSVGRETGFVLQELLREANTMGSKADDATVAQAVIAVKTELEKLREQVENLE
jgi:uncharacterized protein (TIGR00255 family)